MRKSWGEGRLMVCITSLLMLIIKKQGLFIVKSLRTTRFLCSATVVFVHRRIPNKIKLFVSVKTVSFPTIHNSYNKYYKNKLIIIRSL